MRIDDLVLAFIPLIPSVIAITRINNESTLIAIAFSVGISAIGFFATSSLIPVFAEYTLKRGLGGKDFGKRGTDREDIKVPEALGIVCGIVYLVCTICSQLAFAKDNEQLVIYNSALFSICFMIFLGFMDDTLDLKWRYKLILPTIASLPLLLSYSGSTAMYIPQPFTSLLMQDGKLTTLGSLIDLIVTVDTEANGSIVELKYWFLLFMGLQSVFCTNAINILAGINGLECGQSYVIACSLLFFKLFELTTSSSSSAITSESGLEHSTFAVLMLLPFIGTSLGLLRHNWFPSSVFVGDTFCYFSGMTFAVIGIHSHFSKTLLMLFIPQIFNFLYSVPQLFKFLPCPRHRLPNIDPKTHLMDYSYFECKEHEYRWFKVRANDTRCPNCTILCAVLRIFGPMRERSLCIVLLTIQAAFSALAFYIRYFVLENK